MNSVINKAVRAVVVVMIVFVLTAVTGCEKKVHYSGFIGGRPSFRPGLSGGIDHIYFKEDVDFRPYRKIMMDHVVFYLKKDAKLQRYFFSRPGGAGKNLS